MKKYIVIQHPRLGFPLAYIKVPKRHPWMKIKHYDDISLDVHGGVTFMADIEKDNDYFQGFDEGRWIGWDYGHAGDWEFVGRDLTEWNKKMENKLWSFNEIMEDVNSALNQLEQASTSQIEVDK